jgi:hypothetical protein
MRAAPIVILALLVAVPAAGAVPMDDVSAAAKKRRPTAKSCPAGSTPIVVKRGRKVVLKRDRRGRLRCKAVKRSLLRAPARSPSLQVGKVTDMLDTVADIDPSAFRRIDRKIGKRRSDRLLKVALTAWRKTAGAAANETKTFSEGGADGSASFGVEKVEGERSGFKANASAELKIGRDAIQKYGAGKLPPDVTGAAAKVDVSFEDVAKTCPTAKGAVPGKLRGKGSITVRVERTDGPPIEVRLSAEVDTTYTAKVEPDGKVGEIDDVEVGTTFQTGGSGNSTETYRGRILGSGFGRKGFLDAPPGQGTAAVERDWGHIDANAGGVFGPHGSWRYGRGFPISDLRTVDNIKAMAATNIASQILTVAALEYLRQVTLDRIENGPCWKRPGITRTGSFTSR